MALSRITPVDVIIILLILTTSVSLILWAQFGISGDFSDNASAAVYHDGKLIEHISLDQNQELELLDGKMVMEVRDHRVRIKHSECPRRLCVQRGWVSHNGEAIVCVPFKTSIEVASKQKAPVDAIVY